VLIDLVYALKAGYRQNASWVMNRKVQGALRKLKDADGNYLWQPALMGTTVTALSVGPSGLWDEGSVVEVTLLAGHLASAEPLAVLAGSNRLAVEGNDGQWEVIGFADATLVAPGRYRLGRLLRGLDGTGVTTAAPGQSVMVLDARTATVPVEAGWLGESRAFRIHAGPGDAEGMALVVATAAGPALPLAPVHLRAVRDGSGDISISWVRRSRADADGWGVADAPLEHAPELYRVTILSGSTPMRVFDVSTPAAAYGAALQLADFGAPPTSFDFTVAQVSPVLGAGHAAQGEFHG
jgi:hypothetical protein